MKKVAIAAIGLAFLAGAAMLFTASAQASESPCGSVSYLVGKATVTHNGKTIALDIDSPIYNNDLVKTSDKSKVEITPAKATGFSGTIRVSPNTSFYFKKGEVRGQPSSTLDMMAGSVGMKVQKLAGSPSMNVKTDTTACGVRGTDFEVTVTINASVLITCLDGLVAALGIDGDELDVGPSAKGGQAVEREEGGRLRMVKLGKETLAELREKWENDQLTALRSNPGKAAAQMAALYLRKKPAFDTAFGLLERSDALKRWKKEDAQAGFAPNPKSAQTLRDLKEVDAPIIAMRKELVLLERYCYRLEGIRAIIEGTGDYDRILTDASGKPVLDEAGASLTARAFFRRFDREKAEFLRRVGEFRYAEKLHALRNPSGATGRPGTEGESGGGDFFGDEGSEDEGDDFFSGS